MKQVTFKIQQWKEVEEACRSDCENLTLWRPEETEHRQDK